MKEKIALAPEIVLKCIEIHWKEENHDKKDKEKGDEEPEQ